MPKNRFSSEMKQEQISRQQLAERFREFGWVPTPNSIDLGEDFIVHIHLEDNATGVVFHVQEKSVINLAQRQSKDYVSYSLKVKDLLYWENFLLPVALIIWDIKLRLGKWSLIKDLINDLDQKAPDWRQKNGASRVSVKVPWNNTTDNQGLNQLKRSIGNVIYPIISKGKPLNAEFRIPAHAIDKFIKEGEPVVLSGENFEANFPDWWTKWFGDTETKNIQLEIDTIPKIYKATIEFSDKENNIDVASLELRLIRAGTETLKFNNEHEHNPLQCTLNLSLKSESVSGEATFTINSKGMSVIEIKKTIDFIQATKVGGRINFSFRESGDQFSFDLNPRDENEINPEFIILIEKLLVIQSKTKKFFHTPKEGFLNQHYEIINELYEALTNGKVLQNDMVVSLVLKGETLRRLCNIHKNGEPAPKFRIKKPESSTELFGSIIETGPVIQVFQGVIAMTPDEFEEKVNQLEQEEFLSVEFVNVAIENEYLNYSEQSR